jgi:hypothetical protein
MNQPLSGIAAQKVISAATNRFRVWQAVKHLGTAVTVESIADFTQLHRQTCYAHMRSLGIKLDYTSIDSDVVPVAADEFFQRPSDGLTLRDVIAY